MDDDVDYFNFVGYNGFNRYVKDNKIAIRYIFNVLDNHYLLLFQDKINQATHTDNCIFHYIDNDCNGRKDV